MKICMLFEYRPTGWGEGGARSLVGWQVTLCDPIWQVTSRSSVMGAPLRAMGAFNQTEKSKPNSEVKTAV